MTLNKKGRYEHHIILILLVFKRIKNVFREFSGLLVVSLMVLFGCASVKKEHKTSRFFFPVCCFYNC